MLTDIFFEILVSIAQSEGHTQSCCYAAKQRKKIVSTPHSKIRLIQNQQVTHQGVFGGHWVGSTIFGNTLKSVVR